MIRRSIPSLLIGWSRLALIAQDRLIQESIGTLDGCHQFIRQLQALLIDLNTFLRKVFTRDHIPQITDIDEVASRGDKPELFAKVHSVQEGWRIFTSQNNE